MLKFAPGIKEQEYNIAFASALFNQELSSNPTFVQYKLPRDRISKIRKVKEYRKIDIIDRIIRIRADFGLNIKGIKVRNKNQMQKKKQQQYYEEKVLPLLNRIADQWEREHNTVGDTYLHFAFSPTNNRDPLFLTVEDPEKIDTIQAFGIEQYAVRLSEDLKETIRKLKAKNQLQVLPKYIVDQIEGKGNAGRNLFDSGKLILTPENMFRTVNLKADYEPYSEPPLMAIAEALELRRLLTDADFVSAYSAGREIIHTKVGSEKKPAGKNKIQNVHEELTRHPPGVIFFTTGHDIETKRIEPNVKIWDASKYQECNNRILQWSGISVTIINGEGSAYGSALVSVKGFQQSIKSDRKEFERFAQHFFNEINKRNGWQGSKVSLVYDRDALVDTKDFLEEVKYLLGIGILGIEDLCLLFDYDYEEQLEKKKKQKKDEEYFTPHFEMNQGLIGKNGRPAENNNSVRNTNQPKPSG